jgi:hypothetical protein
MQTLKLATAPLLLIAIWMVASVHIISELPTVVPTLRAAVAAPQAMRPPQTQSLAHQSR